MCFATQIYAAQSTIKISEGSSCMGDDRSRKETENAAMSNAKRNAMESVKSFVSSSTEIKDFELQKDLVSAYANAVVTVIEILEKGWYGDATQGDCYRVKIKAEVIPDEKAMKKTKENALDDPSMPLTVKVWTDKETYREGEKIKIYIKGNKPFFGKLVYHDAEQENLQLLPNPYRQDNYFQGGVIYEIPSGRDKFELEVKQPFGKESIVIYASISELGDLKLQQAGSVYSIKTKPKDIGIKTRGIKINETSSIKSQQTAEFSEGMVNIRTRK